MNLTCDINSVKHATRLISWSATKAALYWYPAITKTACGIDCGCKYLYSISYTVENNADKILTYDKIILPGVGAFGDAMEHLKETNLDEAIKEFIKSIWQGVKTLIEYRY